MRGRRETVGRGCGSWPSRSQRTERTYKTVGEGETGGQIWITALSSLEQTGVPLCDERRDLNLPDFSFSRSESSKSETFKFFPVSLKVLGKERVVTNLKFGEENNVLGQHL